MWCTKQPVIFPEPRAQFNQTLPKQLTLWLRLVPFRGLWMKAEGIAETAEQSRYISGGKRDSEYVCVCVLLFITQWCLRVTVITLQKNLFPLPFSAFHYVCVVFYRQRNEVVRGSCSTTNVAEFYGIFWKRTLGRKRIKFSSAAFIIKLFILIRGC